MMNGATKMTQGNTSRRGRKLGRSALAVLLASTSLAAVPAVAGAQNDGGSGPEAVQFSLEVLQPADGFFITEPWVGLHGGSFDLFNPGERATPGLEALAEGGNTALLGEEFARQGRLQTTLGNGAVQFLSPGETVEGSIDIRNAANYRYFSFASMLIPSNDAFIGNEDPFAYELFDASGNFNGTQTIDIFASDIYDAGTEVNDGQGAAGFSLGFGGQGGGTSTDDPTGTVGLHPDLLANIEGFETAAGTTVTDLLTPEEPIARITITAGDSINTVQAVGPAFDGSVVAATAADLPETVQFASADLGRYLEVQPNVNVYTSNQSNTATEFILRDAGDDNFLIQSVSTGLYLHGEGEGANFNANVVGPVDDTAYWRIFDTGSGYHLYNVGLGRLLQADTEAFNVDTDPSNEGASVVWNIVPVAEDDGTGAVFVGTNDLDNNQIASFARAADGTLTHVGNFDTGGAGSTEFDGGEGLDPLISADSIVVTENEDYLITVNAGSDSVSLFAINDDFSLSLVDVVDSGGVGPNSVAVDGDRLFVTNIDRDGLALGEAGTERAEPNDEGNVVGFTISPDGLVPTGFSADLDNRPANISFSTDGDRILVSSITSGSAALPGENSEASLYSFDILRSGRLQLADTNTPTLRGNAEGRNLPSAIDFDISVRNGREFVVVTEAREFNSEGGPPALPALQAGSVTVYELGADSSLTITEGDFATTNGDPAAPNAFGADGQQLTACWIDFGHDGETFYVSNAINATISSFTLNADGSLTLIDTIAAAGTSGFAEEGVAIDGPTTFGTTDGFIDLDVSPDGSQLYQLAGLSGEIYVFDIQPDGSLVQSQIIGDGLPEIDTQGLVSIG